ncbi:MAG: molybdopterin-dependent oxidoreductase [Desulfarculaceae bacterium]|jgi:anaerobic selenocysteine-containing dehydrogenase
MGAKPKQVKTHCGRMDHGGCALVLEVKEGRIVGLKGDPQGLLNQGYICPKAAASPQRLNHPRRLKHPLKRSGPRGEGKWQPISWDQALSEIAANLERIRNRHGARAVAFGAGMPKGLDHFVLIRLANAFGSPNVVASQDVCHAPREISGVHTCGFYPVADLHHQSELVILWGSNITSTNEEGEICTQLLEQIKKGTELIIVDPHRTPLTGRAQKWLRIRPGSDSALALGFIHVIINENLYDHGFVQDWTHGFQDLAKQVEPYTPRRVSELTWIPADLIADAARLYARARPGAIAWGNPLEHNRNAYANARALVCLMAICGNLDAPGGNIHALEPEITGLGRFVRADLLPDKRNTMLSVFHGVAPRFMTIPPAHFRRAVLEDEPYPVRGFCCMGTNPMLTWADSRLTRLALNKLDFLAVADIFMTPTAALADIVLPAATHFEFDDIGHYGLGHGYILARPQAVEPPPQCWPDLKILNELGKLVSDPDLWHDHYQGFLEDVLQPSGLTFADFAEKGYLKGPDRFHKYREQGFKTPTGKVELKLSIADKAGLPPLPEFSGPPEGDDPDYPLVLTGRKNRLYLHSCYRWLERLRRRSPRPLAEMHPQTARAHGIASGDEIVIETKYGRITQTARLTEDLDPRVVYAEYGWWFPEQEDDPLFGWDKSNFNLLTSVASVGREFGTPNLKALPCRIQRK